MRKIEYTTIAFCSIGVIGTLLELPYSIQFTIICFGVLMLFYMLFGFAYFNKIELSKIFKKVEYKAISWKRVLGSIIYGLTLGGGIIMSILYKVCSWPNGDVLTINNLKVFGFVLFISLIFYMRKKDSFHKRLLIRGVVASTFSFLAMLL